MQTEEAKAMTCLQKYVRAWRKRKELQMLKAVALVIQRWRRRRIARLAAAALAQKKRGDGAPSAAEEGGAG